MQNCYSLLVPEILIPNGSDLNDYTTPGHYYTPNAAASQTIQNTPYTGSGFKLIVEKLSSNSHVLQTLKGVNSKFVYYRAASDSDFRDWITPVTNADLGYAVKEIQSFSVTMSNGYATLGTPQEFGVPSGAHVIACTLIGWNSLSSGDIYLTASDTGVYIISGENSISANYIRFRLTYANI